MVILPDSKADYREFATRSEPLTHMVENCNTIVQSTNRGTPDPVYQFDAINSIFLARQEGCSEGDCVPPGR